jgi:hypothetical protein
VQIRGSNPQPCGEGGAALDSGRQLWLRGAGTPLRSSKPTRKSRRREEKEKEEEKASCTDANNAALVTAVAHPFNGDEHIAERAGYLSIGMHIAQQPY